jgi:ABC-type maltose transport system permease subunit
MATQATALQSARTGAQVKTRKKRELSLGKQLLYQAMLLAISFIVLFPILWVVSLSLDHAASPGRVEPDPPALR